MCPHFLQRSCKKILTKIDHQKYIFAVMRFLQDLFTEQNYGLGLINYDSQGQVSLPVPVAGD